MKSKELKKILKPLIKQCIKEVLFEDGVLRNVISEVVSGLNDGRELMEAKKSTHQPVQYREIPEKNNSITEKLNQTKKKMLDSIGKNSYNGVNIFEGTTPLGSKGMPGTIQPPSSPLSGMDPGDSGVDISNIPGMGKWGRLIG